MHTVHFVPGRSTAHAPQVPRGDKGAWVRPPVVVAPLRHVVVLVAQDVLSVVHRLLADLAPVAPTTVEEGPTHPGRVPSKEDTRAQPDWRAVLT
eukprot:4938431-Pyramimonas_sp.AAC.1